MADFDINSLLQNPLFLGGVSGLLADPNDRARALLGGIQTATSLKASQQQQELNQLKLKALQAQQNFNPSAYMQSGTPVPADGAASPQEAQAAQPKLDMNGLLQGGLAAGFSPTQIQQIAAIQDPVAAAQAAAQAKLAEPRVLGPQQAVYVGNTQIAKNDAMPPNQTVQAITQLTQMRDSFPQGSPQYQQYDAALKKATGETEQAQFDQRQRELNDRAAANLGFRQQAFENQQQQQLQTKAGQFSNQLQKIGIPQAQQQLDYIQQTIDKNGGDIPGYGKVESLLPSALLSPEAQGMRQAVASFANVLLKTRSGAAVTEPEQRRFLEEMGTGKLMSADRLKQGLEMMRGLLDSEKKNAAAGVSNDVLDYYGSTPGAMDFSPYRKSGGGGTVSGGMDAVTAEMKRRGLLK